MPESLSLDTLVPYLVEHNAQVVSILVILIILFSMFLGFRGFLSAKNAEKFGGTSDSPSMAQLEETLKKLLEKAETVPSAAQAGAGVSAENTMLLKEIEDLKNSLAEKQVQMEQLERKGPAAGAGGEAISAEDKEVLTAQVKDLQARLAEYEIISEDIADLSFFREENSKLQKELDALKKSGGATAAAPVAAPAPAAPTPTPAPAKAETVTPAVAKAAPEAAVPAPEETDVGQDLVDKLLAQADSISTAPAEPSAIGASSDLDVDKMVAEAAALDSNAAPAKNALEDSLDPDKLLAEAAGMEGKINPEDAKLMGEFEDFMKKGGVG